MAALDATGWDRSCASHHYTQRIKLKIRTLKVTLLVDTGAQTVLDLHLTTTRKQDTQIAHGLAERNLDRFAVLSADKGYAERSPCSRSPDTDNTPAAHRRAEDLSEVG